MVGKAAEMIGRSVGAITERAVGATAGIMVGLVGAIAGKAVGTTAGIIGAGLHGRVA